MEQWEDAHWMRRYDESGPEEETITLATVALAGGILVATVVVTPVILAIRGVSWLVRRR